MKLCSKVLLSILIFSKDIFNVNATSTKMQHTCPITVAKGKCGLSAHTQGFRNLNLGETYAPQYRALSKGHRERPERRFGGVEMEIAMEAKVAKKKSQFQLPTRLRSLHIPSTPWEIAKRSARSPEPQPCTSPKG